MSQQEIYNHLFDIVGTEETQFNWKKAWTMALY